MERFVVPEKGVALPLMASAIGVKRSRSAIDRRSEELADDVVDEGQRHVAGNLAALDDRYGPANDAGSACRPGFRAPARGGLLRGERVCRPVEKAAGG